MVVQLVKTLPCQLVRSGSKFIPANPGSKYLFFLEKRKDYRNRRKSSPITNNIKVNSDENGAGGVNKRR